MSQSSDEMSDDSSDLSSRLAIVTFLPLPLEVKLQEMFGEEHSVHHVRSWTALTMWVRDTRADAIFVDPAIDRESSADLVAQLIATFPSAAVIVYTNLTPEAVGLVHRLTKCGLHGVALYRYDDSYEKMSLLLQEIPRRALFPVVLCVLRKELDRLPWNVRQKIDEVFRAPFSFLSANALAREVNISRAHLYTLFEEAGLTSPKRVLLGARLLRAYLYLQDPGQSFKSVATKCGWTNPRMLRQHLVSAFRMPVAALQAGECPEEDAVKRLVLWIRKGASHMQAG